MNAGELAKVLLEHPTAEVLIFGDEMSSCGIDKATVTYYDKDNYFSIELY